MHHFSWLYLNFYSKSLLITIICEIGFLQIPRSLKKWLETENKLLIHATSNKSERCVLKFIPKPEDFTRVTELAQTSHSVFDQYILLLLVFKTFNDFNFFKGSLKCWFITANICCCTSFPFVPVDILSINAFHKVSLNRGCFTMNICCYTSSMI